MRPLHTHTNLTNLNIMKTSTKKSIALSAITLIALLGTFSSLSRASLAQGRAIEKPSLKEPAEAADALTVDGESQSPKGSCFVDSSTYIRVGDEYKSTEKTLKTSQIDQLRQIALHSQSKSAPDLKDFGITEESVLKNRQVMVESAFKMLRRKPLPIIKFEDLPSEIQQLFCYETVARNALAQITGAVNSAHSCVRVSIPGDPPIVLISYHQQTGRLPWRVIAGKQSWKTYSPEIPKQLAQIVSPSRTWVNVLVQGAPQPGLRTQSDSTLTDSDNWSDGFFKQYGKLICDQIDSFEAIEEAKILPGWSNASQKVSIEDAVNWNDRIRILVTSKDSRLPIDKVRLTISKTSEASSDSFKDWNDFLRWYKKMESDADFAQWLKAWKEADAARSICCIWSKSSESTKWQTKEVNNFWQGLELPNQPSYCIQLLKNGSPYGYSLSSNTFKYSVLTDLGPPYFPNMRLPKMQRKTNASLRHLDENVEACFSLGNWVVIDQKGKQIKKSQPSLAYALISNLPPPTDEDSEIDDKLPVDYRSAEDLEYLGESIEGEEFQSCSICFENMLYGLVNKNGEIIAEPKFERIGPFSEGLAYALDSGGNVGYIDRSGNTAIPFQFEKASTFHEGLAAVRKNGKWGFIDKTGKLAIPNIFDSVRRFSEGVAAARIGVKFGYIDKSGNFVIAQQFGRARHFIAGLAYVQIDGKRAYIDHRGKPIGGRMYDDLAQFAEGRAAFKAKDKYGYIDEKGREAIAAQFDQAYNFRDGIAEVMVGSTKKTIDYSGKFVKTPLLYKEFWDGLDKEGLLGTYKNGKYGFRDCSGRFVIIPSFDEVGFFDNGLCPVRVRDKWGVIDRAGNLVIKAQFDELDRSFSEHLIAARSGKKWGVIDEGGSFVVKPIYDKVFPFSNGIAVIQDGLKFGYINSEGKVIAHPQFDAAHKFDKEGIARICKNTADLKFELLP